MTNSSSQITPVRLTQYSHGALGWPIDKLDAALAGDVLRGARDACARAGIPLAGGHSIDAPEPIFGLAVTGMIEKSRIRSNNLAKVGDELYLTKPLGIGILTTAQKREREKRGQPRDR